MNEYRISPPWIHLKTMDQCYIVQKRVGPRKWMNCCEGSDALFFKTKEAAKAYIKKLTDVDRRERADEEQK